MKKHVAKLAAKIGHKVHTPVHLGYLVLVAVESSHFYAIAAGVLAVVVVSDSVANFLGSDED